MKTTVIFIILLLIATNDVYSSSPSWTAPILDATDSVPVSLNLKEVVVTSRKPDALVTSTNISYSPDGTLSGSSGTAYDALSSLSGVTVDSHGAISINGVEGITVYVDGRKSQLTGEALLTYLKSLEARRLERIEIQSAPSAKNEASSVPVILNLRLKRTREHGFTVGTNGFACVGKAHRGLGALLGSYSNRRLSFSLSYTSIAACNPSELFTDRPYLQEDIRLLQTYHRSRKDRIHNASGMVDYIIADRWKFGGSMTVNSFHRHECAVMDTENTGDHSNAHTDNFTVTSQRNIVGNAYIRNDFHDNNGNITFGIDWLDYRSAETQRMVESSDRVLDGDMGGTVSGFVAAVDLQRTLSECIVLSGGAKSSTMHIRNDGKYTGGSMSSESSDGGNLSSNFSYREYVNAAYTECQFSRSILTFNAGIRAEHTHVRSNFSGNELSGKADYRRDYLAFFPNVTFKIRSGEAGNTSLSYTRGIIRPRYADLNPIIYVFDDITHVGGNINLQSAITNTIQLAYSRNSWLRIALSVTCGNGTIVKYYRELTDRVLYVSPENIARSLGCNLTVSAVNVQLFRFWHLSLNSTMRYDDYRFASSLGIGRNCRLTPMADCRNLIQFPSGWSAELSGRWQGSMAYGQATVGASGTIYLGIRKSVFSGIGNITIFMQDIFNTNHSRYAIHLSERSGFLSEREYEMMRQVGVSFSARFNVGKIRQIKPRHNDVIDEIKRVNL